MTSKACGAKALHARRWTDLPERGTPASLRMIGWIRRAHRTFGNKVAAVSDHIVFRNQRTRRPESIVRILKSRAQPITALVGCLPPFSLFRCDDFRSSFIC
jgi:hypothetical protein